MRFSLRWLFVAVLLIAVSVVALLNASPYWVRGLRIAFLVFLTLAVIGGAFTKGAARAFWIGFAIAGWIYFRSEGLDRYPPFYNHP